MIEVTVGLRPLNTNTSHWPGLHGRSGRPSLTNQLVGPLLWGYFNGVSRGEVRKAQPDQSVSGTSLVGMFHRGQSGLGGGGGGGVLTPVCTMSIALVSLHWISLKKMTSPFRKVNLPLFGAIPLFFLLRAGLFVENDFVFMFCFVLVFWKTPPPPPQNL